MRIRLIGHLATARRSPSQAAREQVGQRNEARSLALTRRTSAASVLHRNRHLCWIAIVAAFVLVVADANRQLFQPVASASGARLAAMTVLFLATGASYWSIARYLRGLSRREVEITDAARLDGVKLATNTLQHQIANKLAVTVGYSEMLIDDPALPVDLQEQANKVLTSAMAAAAVVRKLDKDVIRLELDHTIAGPSVLDVEGSTGPSPDDEVESVIHPCFGAAVVAAFAVALLALATHGSLLV